MEDHVARGPVAEVKVHGQRSQASVASQPERRMLCEDASVHMDANVCLQVGRTIAQDLRRKTFLNTGLSCDGTRRYGVGLPAPFFQSKENIICRLMYIINE